VKKSSLTKIIIDWGGLFHDINLKNNGAIVIPRFSTKCGKVRTSFGDIREKITRGSPRILEILQIQLLISHLLMLNKILLF
jgi:hypothetical protein